MNACSLTSALYRSSQTVETLLQDFLPSCSPRCASCMPPFMCSMLSNKKRLCGASDPAEGRPYQNESPFILLRKYKIVKSNQAKPNQVKSSQVKSIQVKSSQVKSGSIHPPAQGHGALRRRRTQGYETDRAQQRSWACTHLKDRMKHALKLGGRESPHLLDHCRLEAQ